MEAFGYYRVAGLLHKNNLLTIKVGATEFSQWLFILISHKANVPIGKYANVPMGRDSRDS